MKRTRAAMVGLCLIGGCLGLTSDESALAQMPPAIDFVADEYWGVGLSAPEALGYTEAEWKWAVEHEATLWEQARHQLGSKDRKVLDTFASAGRWLVDGAPGKAGYFLGYRIVDDFVTRNGAQSWRRLYDLPADTIISQTRFAPTR